jgi:predicted RecA/RadA family phage recombinase
MSTINNVYPFSATQYNAYKFLCLNTIMSGAAFAGTGCHILGGFTAENAIAQYQPIVPATVPGAGFKVSGSTARSATPVLGVAETAVTAGSTVNIIYRGVVPMIMSGSVALGKRVVCSSSGSTWAIEGVVTAGYDAEFSGSNGNIIGYAVGTGSASGTALVYLSV